MFRLTSFEIGLWVSPPAPEITPERYREIKDAGFTFAIGLLEYASGGETAIRQALDAAHDCGLRYIVHDPRLKELDADGRTEQVGALIAPFADHPAFMGHLLMDEPSAEQIDGLAAVKAAYLEAAPHGLAYVNTFPNHAAPELLRAPYPEYLEKFMKVYAPQILSYDHYPFLTEHSVFAGDDITADYFYNLEAIRLASLQYDVPFWLFIQTLSFNGTHRDPTAAEIRWQVYTSLAFGAKGIQYFTYWTPPDGRESFGDAMIDRSGRRTRHYGEVAAVNRELAAIGGLIVGLRSEGVIAHGEPLPDVDAPLVRFGPIDRIAGDPAIVGCFRDAEGQAAFIAVNRSCERSAEVTLKLLTQPPAGAGEAYAQLDVWAAGRRKTHDIGSDLGAEAGEAGIVLRLEPGEGQLLHFRRRASL